MHKHKCDFCNESLTRADVRDSRQNGTLMRCRHHLILLWPGYVWVWEE
jgi:hypothetical protein